MSSDKIMSIAEKLYTKGFISYPRTETDKFPDTLDPHNFVNTQRQNNEWGAYASSLLDNNKYVAPK